MEYDPLYPSRVLLAYVLVAEVATHYIEFVKSPLSLGRQAAQIGKIAIAAVGVLGLYLEGERRYREQSEIDLTNIFFYRAVTLTIASIRIESPRWRLFHTVAQGVECAFHVHRLNEQNYKMKKALSFIAFQGLSGFVAGVAFTQIVTTPIFSSTVGKILSYIRYKRFF